MPTLLRPKPIQPWQNAILLLAGDHALSPDLVAYATPAGDVPAPAWLPTLSLEEAARLTQIHGRPAKSATGHYPGDIAG
jgi:hypothetical protein